MDIEESGCSDSRPPARCGKAAVSIYRYFPHGGLQKSMMDIVLELQRRNFDVTIFCMSWESEKIPEKVTVRRLRISGSSSSAKAHKFDLALARVLKKRDFDFHLSFNKVSSADGYFVDDLPFVRTSGQIPLWRRLFSRRWRIYSSMEHQVFGKGESRFDLLSERAAETRLSEYLRYCGRAVQDSAAGLISPNPKCLCWTRVLVMASTTY